MQSVIQLYFVAYCSQSSNFYISSGQLRLIKMGSSGPLRFIDNERHGLLVVIEGYMYQINNKKNETGYFDVNTSAVGKI